MIKFFILIGFLLLACDPRVPIGKASPRAGPIQLPSSGPYTQTPLPPAPEKADKKKGEKEAAPSTKLPLRGDVGVVECLDMDAEMGDFNKQLKTFLSTTEDVAKMDWWVKCSNQRPDLQGGAFIKGKVSFKGSKRYSSSARELEVASSSYLEIHLIDIQGRNIKSISMDAEPYQTIQGNHIDLTFKDRHGKLNMRGKVEKGVFSGVLYFENLRGGGSGRIGFFRILSCHFLSC